MKQWMKDAVLELWQKKIIDASSYTEKNGKLKRAAQIISRHYRSVKKK